MVVKGCSNPDKGLRSGTKRPNFIIMDDLDDYNPDPIMVDRTFKMLINSLDKKVSELVFEKERLKIKSTT